MVRVLKYYVFMWNNSMQENNENKKLVRDTR